MNQLEQTITSVEVAEMVGKAHNELLKDIRRYAEQLGEVKIPQSDTYKAIKRSQCDTAVSIIEVYELLLVLAEEITDFNSQMSVGDFYEAET